MNPRASVDAPRHPLQKWFKTIRKKGSSFLLHFRVLRWESWIDALTDFWGALPRLSRPRERSKSGVGKHRSPDVGVLTSLTAFQHTCFRTFESPKSRFRCPIEHRNPDFGVSAIRRNLVFYVLWHTVFCHCNQFVIGIQSFSFVFLYSESL